MKKVPLLLVVLCSVQVLGGCAIVHRYPTYRGKVLELGTDTPIERAGVLMSHWLERPSIAGWTEIYLGYCWAVTDKEGRFTVPAKTYLRFTPLAMFKWDPEMTIHKKGYGGYPTSFDVGPGIRAGKTEPDKVLWKGMPGNKEVTFWLPKLLTRKDYGGLGDHVGANLEEPFELPEGMSRDEFRELFDY